MYTNRTQTGRRTSAVLVLALAIAAGFAAPTAAAALGHAAGAASVTGSRWLPVDESDAVTIVERPAFVDPLAPADRAERIVVRELERRRQLVLDLQGLTADRLERELARQGG